MHYFSPIIIDFGRNFNTIVLVIHFCLTAATLLKLMMRERDNIVEKITRRNLLSLLAEYRRGCKVQFTKASVCLSGVLAKNIEDLFQFSAHLQLPDCLIKPEFYLRQFPGNNLLGAHAFKISNKLFWLRDEIKYNHDNLVAFISYYQVEMKSNQGIYLDNIYTLSRMHDQLGNYLRNKNMNKPNGSLWYEGYFEIFGNWFRDGSNKDMDVTYHQIVLKIVELNKRHRDVPFVIQTTECTIRCEMAYKKLRVLETELITKLRKFIYYHRFADRLIALIIKKLTLKGNRSVENKTAALSSGSNKSSRHRFFKPYLFIFLFMLLPAIIFLWPRKNYRQSPAYIYSKPKSISLPAVNKAAGQLTTGKDNFNVLYDSIHHAVPFVYGIDISRYQGNLMEEIDDLDTLHFIICKATEGTTYKDPNFDLNWNFIKKRGLLRGAYHFYRSNELPVEQANHFLKVVGKLSDNDLPAIVDVEELSLRGKVNTTQLNSSLLKFLDEVRLKTRRKPIIYCDLYFANQYLVNDSLSMYPLWLAEYSSSIKPVIPKIWRKKGYVIWQKKDSYKISSQHTDFDIFNGNGKELAEFIKRTEQ